MTTITAGTSLGSGLVYDSDTTGNLVIKTGSSASIAATFHGNAATTFNGNIHVGNVRIGQDNFLGSLTANGYQRLPGGLILQWGADTATGQNHTVTFPIAFPNAIFSVTVSGIANGTYFIPYNTNPTTTGYTQGFYATGGANGAAASWVGRFIAIGY
jgi:hypothetical protein